MSPGGRFWRSFVVAVVMVGAGCGAVSTSAVDGLDRDGAAPTPTQTTSRPERTTTSTTTAAPTTTTTASTTTTTTEPPTPTLLRVIDRKDGDSFAASDGVEYRLGLVNTPELNEPCGREAADFTYAFLAGGFTAVGYTTDRYGRVVAEVFDAAGESLNVALAAHGFGNDRYLAQYRHENPDLASRLDAAFATAPVPSCGAGAGAVTPPAPVVPSGAPGSAGPGCHAAYSPCVPIQGDGSGRGDANDLDCGQIGRRVQVLDPADPYRLDRDGDGWGCESYG